MVEILNQILNYLVANYALYMVVTMSIIISLTISLISLIKKPIKRITGKIENERLRRFSNKMFIVLAFAFSGAFWTALHFIAKQYFPIDGFQILLTGAFSIVLYELSDGVLTKSKAQHIIETITDFPKDAEQSQKQDDPVKEFWKKVK